MKTNYIPNSGAPEVSFDSTFGVGEVVDDSGFEFPPNEEETIDLKLAMTEALQKALREKGVYDAENPQWTVRTEIVDYEPGNAFARWLLPGAGATKLSVVAFVLDSEERQAAKITSARSIGFGGAYTVGAWKYVFEEVAKEIAETLTDPKKRAK
jgi:hypothetical protein